MNSKVAVFCFFGMGASLIMADTVQHWQFREDRLTNGLRVITLEDHRTPLVNVQVWYHVGSKDENPERQGFAHMFEHMMFRGTERIGPQDHFKYLQRYGARVNGYTNFDTTVYWETLPADQLDRALWLEAERLAHLKINEEYFAAEREVVKEERRMRYLNRPYGRMYEMLFDAAFKVHPYRWTPIGNMPMLDASTADELREFFAKYYVPNNATVVVVGDISHEQVLEKARKYFESIPRRPDPPRVSVTEPPLTAPRRVEIPDIAPSPRVVLAYHAPSARDPDAIALEILSRILATGQSSRLYRHLVQGKEIAINVGAYETTLEQAGLFVLTATLKPNVTIETGEEALRHELRDLLVNGIDPNELEKAKNQAVADHIHSGETVQGRADQLGYAAVVLGDPQRVNTDLERQRAITADKVLDVAKRVFQDDRCIALIIRPQTDRATSEPTEDHSTKAVEVVPELPPPPEMPSGQSPKPIALPTPERKTLANGLRVFVFKDDSVQAVTLSFNSLIGAKCDPPDQAGLAYVTAGTLRRGTRRHTGDELAEIIDRHAMSLSEIVDHNDQAIRMWTLSEHVDLAGDILAEVVREPIFPESEVSGFVSRSVAREAINEKDPSVLASRAISSNLFGGNYLARPAGGTSASLKRIDRDSVHQFHQNYFAPADSALIFAGHIAPDRAFALAEKLFGDWNARAKTVGATTLPAPAETRILLLDRPGSVQSEIRMGQLVSLSRKDPDYAGVRLLSQIFGESFSARLNRSLRIEKGLTYGVSGYFDVRAEAASFKISTFTRTEKTAAAIQAALDEMKKLIEGKITRDELENARDTLIGQFQMALETPSQIANRFWDLIVWGLPEDWYTHYLKSIVNVDNPSILDEIARRKIDPAHLTTIVVGDGQKLRRELETIAPVESQPSE